MYDPQSIPRRSAARLLMSPFAAFYASAPGYALANPESSADAQEKVEAAKVAKKLAKAKDKSHEGKEEREAIADFNEEVLEYVELHQKELRRIGNKELASVQLALRAAIVRHRAKAKQGDVFVRRVQPIFRRLISEQFTGPGSLAAQKAVVEGNPGHDEESSITVEVKVNAAYPPGAAFSTVPPSVLAALPQLPECLHYRFVGRDLILADVVTQTIVDFLPNATPQLIQ